MKKIVRISFATWILTVFLSMFWVWLACAELVSRTFSISVASGATTLQTVTLSGIPQVTLIQEVKVTIPDTTNNVTHTFFVIDPQDIERYSIATLAENVSHILFPNRVIGDTYKFGVFPSAAPGNNITIMIYVTFWR